jgi:peptidoglycan/LPS O-acetylase OafA/YrhL
LYLPIARSGRCPTLATFAKRRIQRIVPPYYALIAIWAALALLTENKPALDVGTSAAVYVASLQTIFFAHTQAGLGHTWTIALELQCYLAMPILVELFRRFKPGAVVVALVAMAAVWRAVIVMRYGDTEFTALFFTTSSLPGRLFEFGAGMYVAHQLCSNKRSTWLGPLCGLVAAIWVGRNALTPNAFNKISPWSDILWGVASAWLLIYAAELPLRRVLEWRPLVRLGEISYSVYLMHMLVLLGAAQVLAGLHGLALCFADLLLAAPVAIAVGYVFHVAIERRFIRTRSGEVAAIAQPDMPRA